MKTRKIGIVLEKTDGKQLVGHLAKLHISIEIDEFWRPVIKTEVEKVNFVYMTEMKKICILTGTIDDAHEVVKEIQNIGYNPSTFFFEEKEYTCEEK